MNYTAAVKTYCNDHFGTILDASYVHEHFFPLIEYRTFLKILKRLESDGTLSLVDKGVYSIRADDIDAAILDFYVNNLDGMIVGNKLYTELGITKHADNLVDVYTNKLPNGKSKHVKNYRLTGVNLFFDKETKRLITLLELIEKRNRIKGINLVAYSEARQKFAGTFPEDLIQTVKAIKYQPGTLKVLRGTGGAIINP